VILNESIPLPDYEELQAMPFFTDPDLLPKTVPEMKSLLHFLRAVKTLKDIGLPGVNNKLNYIEVASMLDVSQRTYALGGAPSKATMRRVVIFHVVTKTSLTVQQRGTQESAAKPTQPPKKRSAANHQEEKPKSKKRKTQSEEKVLCSQAIAAATGEEDSWDELQGIKEGSHWNDEDVYQDYASMILACCAEPDELSTSSVPLTSSSATPPPASLLVQPSIPIPEPQPEEPVSSIVVKKEEKPKRRRR
jgi:hypothetical protein